MVLKPRKGWRVFAGEVGVIVLGVLLALGAQQAVEEMQIRGDVKAFRETIDREIAYNLWVFDFRDSQVECTDRRVAQLVRLLANYREGSQVALVDATYPRTFSLYRSAWDNRDGQVFAHVPARARLKYAEFYDELTNNAVNFVRDREAWAKLVPYEQPGPLSVDDRRTLHLSARTVAFLNSIQHGNFEASKAIGRDLGIEPRKPDGITPEDAREARICRTLV